MNEETRAKSQHELRVASFLALVLLGVLTTLVEAAGPTRNRNRSIYVPLRFDSCEHMNNVTLTVTGESFPFSLGTRIFQFTYYADKKAVLPEFTEVWIEGKAANGQDAWTIRTNLLVTPERITSAGGSLDRGQEEIKKQLRRRIDVRLPESVVHIKCQDSCSRTTASAIAPPADADVSQDER